MFVMNNLGRIVAYMILAFIISPCFFITNIQAATTLQTLRAPSNNLGLIGLWSMDGPDVTDKVYDLSGQGNHGYFIGGATTTAKTLGKIGQGLEVTSSKYVDIPDIIEGLSAITVSAWVRTTDLSGSKQIIIEQSGGGADPIAFDYASGTGGNDYRYKCVIDNGTVTVVSANTSAYTDTEWYHVVCVYNGIDIRVYINGVLDMTPTAQTGTLATTANNLVIGDDNNSSWNGSIDDFRIYNRALSSSEIKRLYNSGAVKQNSSKNNKLNSGLIGLWSFDGTDVTDKVYDRSGQGNDGYLFNVATTAAKVKGKIGQALTFDGVNDRVSIPQGTALDQIYNNGGGGMTVAFWMKPKTLVSSDFLVMGAGSDYEWAINVSPTGRATFNANFDGVSNLNDRFESQLVVGEWRHIVFTWDGQGISGSSDKLYTNGVLQTYNFGDSGVGSPVDNPGEAFSIGGEIGVNPPNADVDDIRIYDRVLNTAEIKQLYNMGGSKAQASKNSKSTSGLVGLWSFDGPDVTTTVTDRSGQGNHGYFIGSATTSAKVKGKIGQALLFDGVDDYVDIPDNTYTDITVCSWVKLNTITPDSTIVGGGGVMNFFITYTGTGLLSVYDGTQYRSATTPFTLNTWGHACMTYIGSTKELSIYMNGIREYNNVGSATYANGTIAKIGGNGFYPMHGSMDDVRIYNRALTTTEIKQLYNMGR